MNRISDILLEIRGGYCEKILWKGFFCHELFLFCCDQEPQYNMSLSEACITEKLLYTQNNGERDCSKIR